MPAKVYTEKEADLKHLKGKTCAIIGFGSQGHAHSLNLKESGVQVVVGLYEGSKSRDAARQLGIEVVSNAEAARRGDIIMFALPDMKIRAVYENEVRPHLAKGKTLLFAHGFVIHYGQVVPPPEVDVIMVAPKGPGHIVRRMYQEGKGVPCLIAVQQNPSGKARDVALAWAKGIGAARAGVIETTFREETETDLFGEQSVLCGGVSALILAAYETLVEAGYSPEMAYFECLHELKMLVDLINEAGIAGMRFSVSETAKYGDLTRGPRVVDEHVRRTMKQLLREIQDGTFAREWILENQAGRPVYNALLRQGAEHPIEKVGAQLRALMPWMKKRDISGVQSAY